ncbi:type III secretion system stator protein SctL [Chromobacterium sp. ATCC 53434]|uniref:type III secretion system stator protein SctL n=1 Tax=Chromobacterium sp. (strain ATCC 53434 / SC 14030) TaxID=2059672 RepID=UPI001305278E|nr:type III secretion system stator protein SctL [Chromobacterium sp. ATCC 53434]
MTPLSLPITKLPGNAPLGTIIPAEDMAGYVKASEIVAQAEVQARQILEAAEREIEQLYGMYEQISEAAWQTGMDRIEEEAPGLRQFAVAEAVEWLIAEQELENKIIERLEGQLSGVLVQVFEEWYGKQSEPQLLANILRERIKKLSGDEEWMLYVSSEQYDELRQALISYPRLRIEPDASLGSGKVLLQTPLAILSLNLDEQFDWVMSRLLSHSREAWRRQLSDSNDPQQGVLPLVPEDFIEARGGDFMSAGVVLETVVISAAEAIHE